MSDVFVPTVRVKNLTKETLREKFPIIGVVEIKPGATKRIPRSVALVWSDPKSYDPKRLKEWGGVPIKILDDGQSDEASPVAGEGAEDKSPVS